MVLASLQVPLVHILVTIQMEMEIIRTDTIIAIDENVLMTLVAQARIVAVAATTVGVEA